VMRDRAKVHPSTFAMLFMRHASRITLPLLPLALDRLAWQTLKNA
jgi:hypothetical protein